MRTGYVPGYTAIRVGLKRDSQRNLGCTRFSNRVRRLRGARHRLCHRSVACAITTERLRAVAVVDQSYVSILNFNLLTSFFKLKKRGHLNLNLPAL